MSKVYVFEGARLHVRQITRFNDFGDAKITTFLHSSVHLSSGSPVVVVVLRCFNLLPIVGSWSLN